MSFTLALGKQCVTDLLDLMSLIMEFLGWAIGRKSEITIFLTKYLNIDIVAIF